MLRAEFSPTPRPPAPSSHNVYQEVQFALEHCSVQIPMLPQTAQRLLRDPDMEIAELTTAIESEPSLVADLLRVCNSPGLTGGAHIASVRRALAQLGRTRVRNLIFAAVRKAVFPANRYGSLQQELLQQSLAVAAAAEVFGREHCYGETDESFAVGLFHNLGQSVLVHLIAELQRSEVLPPIDESVVRELLLTLGFDAGDAAAQQWALPPEVRLGMCWLAPQRARLSGVHAEARDFITFNRAVCRHAGLAFTRSPDPGLLEHPWVAEPTLESVAARYEVLTQI